VMFVTVAVLALSVMIGGLYYIHTLLVAGAFGFKSVPHLGSAERKVAKATIKATIDDDGWAKSIFLKKEDGNEISLVHSVEPGSDFIFVMSHGMGGSLVSEDKHQKGFYPVQNRHKCFTGLKADVLGYDYSGYGASEGERSEQQWVADCAFVMKYAEETLGWPRNKIIVVGQSVGTGVSISYLTKQKGYAGLLLFHPYRSIAATKSVLAANTVLRPVDLFQSQDRIGDIDGPVAIVHAVQDPKVPFHNGDYLQQQLQTMGKLWKFFPLEVEDKRDGHSKLFDKSPYKERLHEITGEFLSHLRQAAPEGKKKA